MKGTKMKLIAVILVVCMFVGIGFFACDRSNNLLLGRVEATVGGHTIAVTDCYRTSVPPPQKSEDPASGKTTYRFTPCRDADIAIRDEELVVNGQSYGKLIPSDAVTVDHGRVLVNDHAAIAVSGK